MKIGVILNTNEAETVWNCFRFALEALKKNHFVKVFLLGKGVEAENIKDDKFPFLEGTIKKFLKNNGVILACGTCLKLREKEESKICPVSTMEEMLLLVEESDRVLAFG
ncbi:DsrE family protein [Candidatus Woesearchaeota archaeon]|nr:DsrE family protein [Candidatus Woesearchaeota archaeon]